MEKIIKGIILSLMVLTVFVLLSACSKDKGELFIISDFSVVKDTVKTDEKAVLKLTIKSDGSNVAITAFVINGVEYQASVIYEELRDDGIGIHDGFDNDTIFLYDETVLYIQVDTKENEGLVEYQLEKIKYLKPGKKKTDGFLSMVPDFYELKDDYKVNVSILEAVIVEEITFESVNKYYQLSDEVTVKFKISKNPEYQIESIKINDTVFDSSQFITNANQEISVKLKLDSVNVHNYLFDITYSIDGIVISEAIDSRFTKSIYVDEEIKVHYIHNLDDLMKIEPNHVNILMTDLDLSNIHVEPIRNFNGYFNGNGFTIKNLSIEPARLDSELDYIGLFAVNRGLIENLRIENFTIEDSNSQYSGTGGLVGNNLGTILNSTVTGKITLPSTKQVGGLVGVNEGLINESRTEVTLLAQENVGGLVGSNKKGTIIGSNALGKVNATESQVGGLVGYNNGKITSSYASVDLKTEADKVGGLVGYNKGTITNSYATGDVSGKTTGGLVGVNEHIINKTISSGNVNGFEVFGGLVGHNFGFIANSLAMGNVSGVVNSSELFIGLLPQIYGKQTGDVTNIYRYKHQIIKVNQSTIGDSFLTAAGDEDLISKEWYLENLNFDENVWDFNQVGTDKRPSLR